MAQAAAKSVMFVWEGRDKQGKKVKGEMSGTSDALVKAMLRRQGINPMRVGLPMANNERTAPSRHIRLETHTHVLQVLWRTWESC